jgi:hypothetical protein
MRGVVAGDLPVPERVWRRQSDASTERLRWIDRSASALAGAAIAGVSVMSGEYRASQVSTSTNLILLASATVGGVASRR